MPPAPGKGGPVGPNLTIISLVDSYRDHLSKRRLENPAVPVTRLFQEIRELGYTGSSNLLVRYINQGRVEADRSALSPPCLARYLLTRPDRLKDHQRERIEAARTACREMTALVPHQTTFALSASLPGPGWSPP